MEIVALPFITLVGLLVVLWLARTWLIERITRSVQNRYNREFEEFRSALQQDHEISMQRIQQLQTAANSGLAEGQRVTAERRIEAVNTVWLGMVKLKRECPTALGMLDISYPQEYEKMWTSKGFKDLVGDISIQSIAKEISDDGVDRVRPFVGETCYSLYACYRAIFGRIAIKLSEDVPAGKVNRWFEDPYTRTLLSTALADHEFKTFDELPLGKLRWLTETFENKILEQMHAITSGRMSTEEGLEQARRILVATQTALDPEVVERTSRSQG